MKMKALCPRIVLTPAASISADLFDGIAREAARIVAEEGRNARDQLNKPTQLRRFYDELLRWEEKVDADPAGPNDGLRQCLPFIRMMNAKAAYAQGRNLVGASFVALLRRCLEQMGDDPAALRNCRYFLEAFMGFYKLYGPQG